MQITNHKVDAGGVQIHVVDYGGTGEPIVCIHGITANARFWDAVAEQLTPSYRVLAVDLRGRGDSEKPTGGYNIPQHAQDIRHVLTHFQIDNAIIMGHSLGAMISICFTATYPESVKRLLLVDGGEDLNRELEEVLKPSFERLGQVYANFNEYTEDLKTKPFFQPWNSYVQEYFYADVHHHPNGTVSTRTTKAIIDQEIEALYRTSVNQYHNDIHVPALLFYAPNCLYHPTAYLLSKETGQHLAAKWKNSRFIEVPGSNHFSIIFSEYKVVAEEIRQFLEMSNLEEKAR
ncbi:alpha/beta fold hydrolase [Oceanobacillus saliphilus]|uniref:alpha/beta fold hydrolase n=1 Tax=Oceanobacillus saliphilus TaxID=2925834 RepID=UPI00201E0D98|nr:alpha/beta hydrolase [Oceanobacillus saliphilus]